NIVGIDLRVPPQLAGRGIDRSDRAGKLGVEFGIVGRRLPGRGVHVGAEEQRSGFGIVRRRAPDTARCRAKIPLMLAPFVLDDDWGIELFWLRPDVVLPDDLSRFWFERHEEATAGAAGVALGSGE